MSIPSVEVVVERVDNLKRDLNDKHGQNRRDIHSMRNDIQTLAHEIWMLKVKIAAYSSAAGVITAIAIKLIDHIWKT